MSRRPAKSAGYAPPKMSHSESRAWEAATAVLDRVAADMERQWGVGRLPQLVSPETAARFALAEEQCEVAIASGDIQEAALKAGALARGWHALDKEARDRGHKPADVGQVWCVAVEGRPYAVCLHTADSGAVAAMYPDHTAISVLELLRVLHGVEAGRIISKAKELWPGAAVTARKPSDKPPADWSRGDEIPF